MTLLMIVDVPYWWHATLLEILWLAGGLTALPLAIANWIDAVKDTSILDDIRADPAVHSRHYFMIEQAAKGQALDHSLTVVSSSAIVFAGIVGCVVKNPLGGATTATGFAITIALLLVSGVTALRAYAALVRRSRMYELAAGRTNVLAAEMREKVFNRPPDQQ